MIFVSADQIFDITKKLIPYRIPLFIEKPAGLIPSETKDLLKLTKKYGTKNMVGYNRRYYSIFNKGIDLIKKNGDLLGISIEGHERFWNIEKTDLPKKITNNWIYANSTHTIDLLRFFGGDIKSFSSYSKRLKSLTNDQFVASMEFKSGSLGTYVSHWFSPGGWSLKLYGENITVEYKPLENGIWYGTDFIKHEITSDEIDSRYKPGFYRQIKAFENLIITKKLDWPGVDLESAFQTMELAKNIANF